MTQISNMSNFGDGHGCGYRDGYGAGHGCIDGYGYGNGDGHGHGDGYEHGHGNGSGRGYMGGYGYGYKDGDGHGCGYGDSYGYGAEYGNGCGYGEISPTQLIGEVSGYPIDFVILFGLVRIGCKMLSLNEWKKQWRAIAENNNISISETEVRLILEKCQAYDSN
jgi:hypothetical protein